KRRISLGLKHCLGNPWEDFQASYPVGNEIEGEIKNITEFGLFVGLPGDIDGMIHLSDLDWSRSGDEAVKDYKKGDTVKVKILDVDTEKERISLGVKQLGDDPFTQAADTIKKGKVVTGTVHQVLDTGIEVELAGGALGFIRKAELSRDRSERRPTRFAVGEKVDARITSIDKKNRKIALSIKQREIEEEKQAMASYGSSDSGASLGEILGAAISKAAKDKGTQDDEDEEGDAAEASGSDEEAPAEEAAAEEVATEEAVTEAEEAPAEEAAAEEVATEEAVTEAEDAPAEDAAAEEIATEEAVTEAEEAPAEEAASEEAEAEEAASDDAAEAGGEEAEDSPKKDG
ncbi:MAG: S1 RNA-binding domain-containing protein, partial [Kiloniellales bacterium]